MTYIIRHTEGTPTNYPIITGLSEAADALNKGALWRRIEHHVAYRWAERNVMWWVEGIGEFIPPLGPALVNSISIWNGTGWEGASLDETPLGYDLNYSTYLFDTTVGTDYLAGVPDDVAESYRRLAEYLAVEDTLPPGVTEYTLDVGGDVRETTRRSASHTAKALVNSGAADLLRPYRRI